jgi:hypothetical protein
MMPATADDVAYWKETYQLEHVLYEPDYTYVDLSLYDRWEESGRVEWGLAAFPYFFYIHTAHMRIWDTMGGFPQPFQFDEWMTQELGVLDYCAQESGVITD